MLLPSPHPHSAPLCLESVRPLRLQRGLFSPTPAVSAPVPTANFLPPHTEAPRAHLEPSDLHLERKKINSTKRCLFFLLFFLRQTFCGSWDPEWVIKAISVVGELGTSGAFTVKNKGNCNSSLKGVGGTGGETRQRKDKNGNKTCLTQLQPHLHNRDRELT